MKEKLIELSEKLGFQTKLYQPDVIHVDDDYYYLWMCELQKWLRNEDKLFISIDFFHDGVGVNKEGMFWDYQIAKEIENTCFEVVNGEESYKTYEKALEKGLFEALKIIK
jgi:hypothetical protein